MNPLYVVYFLFVTVISAFLWAAVRRRKPPNYWRGSNPDPSCQRFPDWRVNKQRER